jgi:hypothetical protein
MLDEHLLNQPVRLAVVFVVMPLADLTDLGELRVAECATAVAERLEGVFGLPGHHDVPDEPEEITLPRRVGEIPRLSENGSEEFFSFARFRAQRLLVVLEHSLMLSRPGNMPAAEIAKPAVLGLLLMILERFEKGAMLHYGVVYLAFEKIETAIHLVLQLILTPLQVAQHGPWTTPNGAWERQFSGLRQTP